MATLSLLDALQQIDPDKSFRDEELEKLDTSRHEQTRIEKREKRLRDCGEWSNWYNPHSGKRTGFIFKCGLFRYCNVCLERRANEESGWMKIATIEKRMVAVRIDAKKATKLIRKADKTEYIRYPLENGQDFLLLDESLGIKGKAVDLEWVAKQDWKTIVNTPEGRNKSGTMHVPVDDNEEKEFTIINTQQFVTNAGRNKTLKAMKEAEQETADLNPKTADQVVCALRKRTRLATRKLREQGYSINLYNKKLKLIHSMVNWQGSVKISSQIKRYYTENPTRAINTSNPPNDLPIASVDAVRAATVQPT